MHWTLVLFLIIGGLIGLMSLGVPIALAFLGVNCVAMIIMFDGLDGLRQLVLSMYSSVTLFALVPIPMFILMGEIMFHSGIAFKMMDALDKWIGRLPGRLSILAVAGGTIFGTLSGSSVASTAMLGEVLVPRMESQGYRSQMTIGPILGSGTLAAMIPPSALGVLLASLAKVSVADFLLAIVIPGVIMALVFAIYIVARCTLQPEIAPKYDMPPTSMKTRLIDTAKYILPLGIIIFLVIGVMIIGVATPNEAAALGALGSLALAFIYNKGFKWSIIRKSLMGTITVTGMILLILAGSTAFSQLLAFTGASAQLVEFVSGLNLPALVLVGIMQVVLIIMGMFMEPLSILMIAVPLMMPIIISLGLDPIWFCVLVMLNMEMAAITPPFGMSLFVMKGILGRRTSMGQVYAASYPFVALDVVVMALLMAFPALALWLPSLSR